MAAEGDRLREEVVCDASSSCGGPGSPGALGGQACEEIHPFLKTTLTMIGKDNNEDSRVPCS